MALRAAFGGGQRLDGFEYAGLVYRLRSVVGFQLFQACQFMGSGMPLGQNLVMLWWI